MGQSYAYPDKPLPHVHNITLAVLTHNHKTLLFQESISLVNTAL